MFLRNFSRSYFPGLFTATSQNLLVINIKKNRKTYEMVTGDSSSKSTDPGDGHTVFFSFLCLVGVSRTSLQINK